MVAFVFTEDEIDKNNEYYMNTNNSLKYDFIEDSIKLFVVFMCRLALMPLLLEHSNLKIKA